MSDSARSADGTVHAEIKTENPQATKQFLEQHFDQIEITEEEE